MSDDGHTPSERSAGCGHLEPGNAHSVQYVTVSNNPISTNTAPTARVRPCPNRRNARTKERDAPVPYNRPNTNNSGTAVPMAKRGGNTGPEALENMSGMRIPKKRRNIVGQKPREKAMPRRKARPRGASKRARRVPHDSNRPPIPFVQRTQPSITSPVSKNNGPNAFRDQEKSGISWLPKSFPNRYAATPKTVYTVIRPTRYHTSSLAENLSPAARPEK